MKRSKKTENSLGRFVGLPHWVMHHAAFREASHRARALLLDVALQYTGSNNGKLVVCEKAMKPLGWNSKDGLTKAKRELVELGLLVETRRGAKPNRAAWYALSWRPLDVKDGLDISVRSYVTLAARKNDPRPPHGGVEVAEIGPSHGVRVSPSTPQHGPMRANFDTPSTPPHGAYLDVAIPSAKNEEVSYG